MGFGTKIFFHSILLVDDIITHKMLSSSQLYAVFSAMGCAVRTAPGALEVVSKAHWTASNLADGPGLGTIRRFCGLVPGSDRDRGGTAFPTWKR